MCSRKYNSVVLGFSSAVKPVVAHMESPFRKVRTLDKKVHTPEAQTECRILSAKDKQYLVERLGVSAIRPAQLDAFNLLLEAAEFDTKIIQGPTSMGKDMLPFMLSCHTRKAQLLLVPFTPLVDNAMSEGRKYSCNVVKFIDIGKSVTLETAAATADIIVCSYEHAPRLVRVVQELTSRDRMGEFVEIVVTSCITYSEQGGCLSTKVISQLSTTNGGISQSYMN